MLHSNLDLKLFSQHKSVLCILKQDCQKMMVIEAGDVQSFILYIVDAVYSKTGRGVASAIVSTMKNYFLGDSNCLI